LCGLGYGAEPDCGSDSSPFYARTSSAADDTKHYSDGTDGSSSHACCSGDHTTDDARASANNHWTAHPDHDQSRG
jgi:hypothetical protein